MNRIPPASAVVLAVLALGVGPATAEGPPPRTPNVVLMMADDLGWGDVGFHGHRAIRTPHLDAMAAAGMRLDRFYAAAPVCSPTRGSCLTGRHPYRFGITFANVGHLPREEFTLAEALREHGYATGHFGKWHLGTLTTTVEEANRGGPRGAEHFAPPWERGFDTCFSTEARVPTWDPMLKPKVVTSGSWWYPVSDPSEAERFDTHYWTDGEPVLDELRGDDSKLIMDRAVRFIGEATAAGRPFFAVIWFHAPHLPVVAGPEYTALYPGLDDFTRHYYGCITAMDEQVGRLRQTLRDRGAAEDTLVFFCSDNGPEGELGRSPGSAGPFRGRKRSLFEGGVRVPAIVEWPAVVEPGRASEVSACTSDYLPTVLEILGHPATGRVEPVDGISLLPLLEGRIDERPRPIAFESGGQLALIDHRYKLVLVPDADPDRPPPPEVATEDLPFALYDLLDDPAETRNLAAEHPDLTRSMAETLAGWRRSCAESLRGADYPAAE